MADPERPHRQQSRNRPLRSWDLASRPWGHARPLGRANLVSRSLHSERQSLASEEGSHSSRRSRTSWVSEKYYRGPRSRSGVSDAASHVLDEEIVQGEAEYYRHKYVQRSRNRRRGPLSDTDASLMPALSPDALSPEDAADAHDRGEGVGRLEDYQEHDCFQSRRWGPLRPLLMAFAKILTLAETDYESGKILSLAIPSTIGAVADPLFRLVLLAIISHYVDTDSMVAFVLVILFIRLTTEEISAAVTRRGVKPRQGGLG